MRRKIIFAAACFAVISFLGSMPIHAQEGHHAHDHNQMGEADKHVASTTPIQEVAGICPVMGGETSEEYSYTYQGKTYYFCCPMCIEEFKKDPEKYISKIKKLNLQAYQFGFSPERIVVKKDDIVKIHATSKDVTHGVYIQAYDVNVSVAKGEENKIEFIANKTGEFDILCSVYCGAGHHQMKAKLIVEE